MEFGPVIKLKPANHIDIQTHNVKYQYDNISRSYDVKTNKTHEQVPLTGVAVAKNVITLRPRRRTYSPKISNEQCVFELFGKFEIAIQAGNLDELKKLIEKIYLSYDKTLLANIYYGNDNPIRHTHLITLACEHKQVVVLHFLLQQSDILYYLPSSGTVVEKSYKQALRETMKSHNIHLLEMLYDYLSGVVHWPSLNECPDSDKTITNLKTLNHMLIESQNSCKKHLDKDEQMLIDVHCLISFNNFQINLYDKLSKLKIVIDKSASESDLRKSEVEAIICIISNVFKIYEAFTAKNIRVTKDFKLDKDILEPHIKSDTSIFMKYLVYRMYEIYYRKLDFNIALLILNNLHLLKQRLNLPEGAYQEIECTLYYFLYRVYDEWRIYLPDYRPKCKKQNPIAIGSKNRKDAVNVLYDPYRLLSGPVIYLEWLKFRKSLKKIVNTLECTEVQKNLRWKIPKDEQNSLTLLPYMKDEYSLKKMIKYIEAISKVNLRQDKVRSLLVIQRVVQVIGEFLKNGDDEISCHLSSTTKALLQVEIPKSVIQHILNLRNAFLHCRDGQLIKRIDIEKYESKIFEELISDIEKIGNAINEVIKLYKPILEKGMIEMGLQLIEDRFNELPLAVEQFKLEIDALHELFALADHDMYLKMENDFLTNKWYKEGFTKELYREIGALNANKKYLFSKCNEKFHLTEEYVKAKIPKYKIEILKTLNAMKNDRELWSSIKKELGYSSIVSAMNYPNKTCKQKIINELKDTKICKSSLNKTKEKLDKLRDWSDDWVQIKFLFNIFFIDGQIFQNDNPEIVQLRNDIDKGSPDETGIVNATRLIDLLFSQNENYCTSQHLAVDVSNEANNDFRAITDLSSNMKKKLFLTKEESDYLLKNINFVCSCVLNSSRLCDHCNISKKIKSNETLTVKEFKKLKSLNIGEKCRKAVENLVIGYKRDNKFLECLVYRAKHLDELLEGVRDRTQLVFRYKNDHLFRIAMEIVICDILNVFSEGCLKELFNVRFCKMLSEIPLRNVLAHGNPHLDVIGPVLDSNDFPRALISFALDFIEDGKYLKEYLLKLYDDNVDYYDVYNSSNLSAEQMKLVDSFKQCAKWKIYAKLLQMQPRGN